jgi:hypothetical protein
VLSHETEQRGVFKQFRGEMRKEVAWHPGPHEGYRDLFQVAGPFDFPGVGGVQGFNRRLRRGGLFDSEYVGAQALTVRGDLFVQPAGALDMPAEEGSGSNDTAAAALTAD